MKFLIIEFGLVLVFEVNNMLKKKKGVDKILVTDTNVTWHGRMK